MTDATRATSTLDIGLPRRSGIGAAAPGLCAAEATQGMGHLNTVEHWKAKTDEFHHMMLKTIEQNVRGDQIIALLMQHLGVTEMEFTKSELNEAPIRSQRIVERDGKVVVTR